MTSLFGKSRATINEHILNVYGEKELIEEATMRKIGISDFSTKPTNFYNLDVIISVGYRVKSTQGTQFLAYAEAQALAHRLMYMSNWIDKLGQVLTMNEKNILDHAGKISHKLALEKAEGEYSKFIDLQGRTPLHE